MIIDLIEFFMTFKEKFPRFTTWIIKWHINYLLSAILLYGFKAAIYFLIAKVTAAINAPYVMFNMEIDRLIPFIPEFHIFYLGYYFVPEIFLWILSFYNKRKVFDLIFTAAVVNVLCCICFIIQQVKMDRVAYEVICAPYHNFHGVTSLREFFYAACDFQYNADDTALNCFPSLHASFGTMLMMVGIPLSKKENHLPLWIRIFTIIFGAGIVMSTFFVKQHYFIDAIVSVALMFIMFFLVRWLIDIYLKNKEKKKLETQTVNE